MEDKMAKNRITLGGPFSRRLNLPKSQKIKRSFFKLNKKAFTLAEVLITLTIIGVVSALTIPTLTQNIEKQKTVTALKKAHAELAQVVERAKVEHGDVKDWDFNLSGFEFFDTYLNNYLIVQTVTRAEFNKQNNIKYKEISGKEETGLSIFRFGEGRFLTLPSGAHIMQTETNYYNNYYGRRGINIDINGLAPPNTLGKDVFFFVILQENGRVVPHYFDDQELFKELPDRKKLKDGPSSFRYQCNKQGRGLWCGALIYADGWKISKDYPW